MIKMTFTDNQTALEYATYMMVGSYFKRTTCANSILLKKLRVQYCEQKLDKQYKLEDSVIGFTEKKLMAELPGNIWEGEAKVRFILLQDGRHDICFEADGYTLRISCGFEGHKSSLKYRLAVNSEAVPA